MTRETVLEFVDEHVSIEVSVDAEFGLVFIRDAYNQFVTITVDGLTKVNETVTKYMGFTEEDIEAGRRAIAKYIETVDKKE